MKFHSFVLFVEDIEKSVNFYKDILKYRVEHDFNTCVVFEEGLSIWKINDTHPIKPLNSKKSNRFELCFEHEEIEQLQENLEKNGVSFLHKIMEESWGQKTIRFFDPENNIIEVGEPLEVFVMRLYKEGMSVEQVVEKTGVDKDFIMMVTKK